LCILPEGEGVSCFLVQCGSFLLARSTGFDSMLELSYWLKIPDNYWVLTSIYLTQTCNTAMMPCVMMQVFVRCATVPCVTLRSAPLSLCYCVSVLLLAVQCCTDVLILLSCTCTSVACDWLGVIKSLLLMADMDCN